MTAPVPGQDPLLSADAWMKTHQRISTLDRIWAPWISAGIQWPILSDVIRPLTDTAACSRLQHAELLAEAGFRHVILTRPIVDPDQLRHRLPLLLSRVRLTVTVDHFRHVELLSAAASPAGHRIGVLLDADPGAQVTGLRPGPDTSRLALAISALPGLIPEGIHVDDSLLSAQDSEESFLKCLTIARQARRSAEQSPLKCPSIVTGRSTAPELFHAHPDVRILLCGPASRTADSMFRDVPQPGAGEAWSSTTTASGTRIVARVLSRPSLERCVLDAGSDRLGSASEWTVPDPPGARILQILDDVTTLMLSDAALDLTIGQRVILVDKTAPQ